MLLVDGFKPPSIHEFLPPAIFGDQTIIGFNRIDLIRLVATVVMLTFFIIVAKKAKVIPTKPQIIVEFLIDFVQKNIIDVTMGRQRGKEFTPMICTLFISILFFNLTGIIPGLNMAATAGIGLPLVMALWTMWTYWKVGIREQGLFGFLHNETFPSGLPVFIYPLYTPIELAQLFIIRPFSLTVRLFANMVTGHILIALCISATQFLLFDGAGVLKPFSLITFIGAIFFILFEVFVASLQAYVFAILSATYIAGSFKHT